MHDKKFISTFMMKNFISIFDTLQIFMLTRLFQTGQEVQERICSIVNIRSYTKSFEIRAICLGLTP